MKNITIIMLGFLVCGCAKNSHQESVPSQSFNSIEYNVIPEKFSDPIPEWKEKIFEGTWNTTSRKVLDGIMRSHIVRQGNNKWKGRFWGVWHGVSFDYNVDFEGSPDRLTGKAVIDGLPYDWSGSIQGGVFDAKFHGGYEGSFLLKEVIYLNQDGEEFKLERDF